ncbi:hypothetical protein BGZ96_004984, partial [Linnemannia gamsii]
TKTYRFQRLTFRNSRNEERNFEEYDPNTEYHEQTLSGASKPYYPWFQIFVDRRRHEIYIQATKNKGMEFLSKVFIYPFNFGGPVIELDFNREWANADTAEYITTDMKAFGRDLHWLTAIEPYTSI